MKKIFLGVLVATSSLWGCATTNSLGIRQYNFAWFPTVDVVVVNDCVDSVILVRPPRGQEVAIQFGDAQTISLSRYPGEESSLLLVVRGVGRRDGAYLGSDSRSFYVGAGKREESWHVSWLRGGQRPCR